MTYTLLLGLLHFNKKLRKRKDQGLIWGHVAGILAQQESETRSANAKPTVLPTEPLGTQTTKDQDPRAVAPSCTDFLVAWGCLWSPALSYHFHWINSRDISSLMTCLQWFFTEYVPCAGTILSTWQASVKQTDSHLSLPATRGCSTITSVCLKWN